MRFTSTLDPADRPTLLTLEDTPKGILMRAANGNHSQLIGGINASGALELYHLNPAAAEALGLRTGPQGTIAVA